MVVGDWKLDISDRDEHFESGGDVPDFLFRSVNYRVCHGPVLQGNNGPE